MFWMQRWFLSYHSPDQALAEQLKAAIESKDGRIANRQKSVSG